MPRRLVVGGVWLLLFLIGLALVRLRRRPQALFLTPVVVGSGNQALSEQSVRASMAEAENIWRPDLSRVYTNPQVRADPPRITGKSALAIDTATGKILFSLNPRRRQSVASTIKILTAVVALDQASPEKLITITERAAGIGEDTMGLTAGEKYTLKELLYGLLLPSGNDAAEAIADGVGGDRATFVGWMNEKARYLGLEDTLCTDPSGLADPGDENQYSTAYDLLVITYYALNKYPLIKEIVSTEEFELAESASHKYVHLWNMTNLLDTYPGVYGVKPGYNDYSGLCLVTACRQGGHNLLAVVLGSDDRRGDMRALLDYSWAQLGVETSSQ